MGDRRAGRRAHGGAPPSWARSTTSSSSPASASSAASSWRSTSRSSARPTTRGSPSTRAWFAHRPDGTIQYAENPPKKYQDIYPLDFESEDWQGLWTALADVIRFWIDTGVTIFRVDNPHTKAFAFWEWAIATIRSEHPEAIFLAEAFTRPRVMERLAKIGFNQSYTYFTWRQSSWELRQYFEELATSAPSTTCGPTPGRTRRTS